MSERKIHVTYRRKDRLRAAAPPEVKEEFHGFAANKSGIYLGNPWSGITSTPLENIVIIKLHVAASNCASDLIEFYWPSPEGQMLAAERLAKLCNKDLDEGRGVREVAISGFGPKRMEVFVRSKKASKQEERLALLYCEKPSSTTNVVPAIFTGKVLDGDKGRILEKRIFSSEYVIVQLETFPGGPSDQARAFYFTGLDRDQDNAWEKIFAYSGAQRQSELNIVRNWDHTVTDADRKGPTVTTSSLIVTADDDETALYGGPYHPPHYGSGYGGYGSSQYCYVNHTAEFRVAGDEVGAKIILKREEAAKKAVAPAEGQSPTPSTKESAKTSDSTDDEPASAPKDQQTGTSEDGTLGEEMDEETLATLFTGMNMGPYIH